MKPNTKYQPRYRPGEILFKKAFKNADKLWKQKDIKARSPKRFKNSDLAIDDNIWIALILPLLYASLLTKITISHIKNYLAAESSYFILTLVIEVVVYIIILAIGIIRVVELRRVGKAKKMIIKSSAISP